MQVNTTQKILENTYYIYGLITSANYIKSNQDKYLLFKKTYINRLDGVNTDEYTNVYNNNELINLVEYHKRNRDIYILLFSLTYLLNIVDHQQMHTYLIITLVKI